MTEFDFGSGPVPAHRHLNGGGWVADTAIVADTQIVRNYDKLDAQLNILSADFSEDFGRCLDQASVAGLRKFLQMHQEVALPTSISADPDGKLEATWRSADSQSASFKFVDQEKFHYALLVETAAGRKRPWGTSSRSEIFLARPEARTILGKSATP